MKVIIRTYSAGVHYGTLKSENGKRVELTDARRIWYWSGAFTLSALAQTGPRLPGNCKFSCTIPSIILTEAIEIIPCSDAAIKIIEDVKDHE